MTKPQNLNLLKVGKKIFLGWSIVITKKKKKMMIVVFINT